jgi:hypothetical protein
MNEPTDAWRPAVQEMLEAWRSYFESPTILAHETLRLRVERLDELLRWTAPGNGPKVDPEPCIGPDD